ncbi:hypothetical protein DFH09DRAFT_1272795 [Mycena vulgaris]|nr:hypothetical protein DFH09DRAFT_1272795 [Mycena vulgaris]
MQDVVAVLTWRDRTIMSRLDFNQCQCVVGYEGSAWYNCRAQHRVGCDLLSHSSSVHDAIKVYPLVMFCMHVSPVSTPSFCLLHYTTDEFHLQSQRSMAGCTSRNECCILSLSNTASAPPVGDLVQPQPRLVFSFSPSHAPTIPRFSPNTPFPAVVPPTVAHLCFMFKIAQGIPLYPVFP